MSALPLPVLELVSDALVHAPLGKGAYAQELQAADLFALSLVQRSNRRVALQGAAWRCHAAAQRHRHAMWREHLHDQERRLHQIMDGIADLDDVATEPRVRQLARLRAVDQQLLRRLLVRRPSLLQVVQRERVALQAQQAEQSEESE